MAWFRVQLTEEQQRIVNEERTSHPNLRVREKMLVLWLLHCGTHPAEGRRDRRRRSCHRPSVRGRVSRGRPGRPAAMGPPSPGRARWPPIASDPRVLREATGPHHGRGVRADLSTDRVAARSQPGAEVPQGHGPEVPAGPPDPRAAQKNLAEHVQIQAEFPRRPS